VEGTVARVDAADSDAYFATRPRDSQVGAWASRQSAPLGSRPELLDRFRSEAVRLGEGPVPRPETWGGYRLVPERVEFWTAGEHRLHDRVVFTRQGPAWRSERLFP
jgi:pyridoxamine 5'-phosphate oxidase